MRDDWFERLLSALSEIQAEHAELWSTPRRYMKGCVRREATSTK